MVSNTGIHHKTRLQGAISVWYISKYFPRLVKIERTGDVIIHNSHVKVFDPPSVKNQGQK